MAQGDGSVLISVDLELREAEKELARLKDKILRLHEDLYVKKVERTNIEESLANAKAALAEIQSQTKFSGGRAITTPENVERITELREKISGMEADLKAANAAIEKTTENLRAERDWFGEVEKSTREIHAESERAAGATEGASDAAKDAQENLQEMGEAGKQAGESTSEAMKQATSRLEKFEKRIAGLVKRVFVFSLITMALRNMRKWLVTAVEQNEDAAKAIARLKGALLTLGQAIVIKVLPYIVQFINILAQLAETAARIVSKILGISVKQASDAAKELNDEQNAIKGVGAAAKKASKSLASFDEINKLSDSSGGTSGGAIAPDFQSVVNGALDAVTEMLTGAALVALGCILLFSGISIPLGLAMVVAGGLAIWDAVTENPEEIKQWIKDHAEQIVTALLVAAAVAVVLGVILLFTGHVLSGIGLILLGVGLFVASKAAGDVDEFTEWVKDHTEQITSAIITIAAVAAVIGIIMLFTGHILAGIGLILAAAALFAAAAKVSEGEDGDDLQTWIQIHAEQIVTTILAIAELCVVVGIILLFTGKFLAGVGLIILGISALVSAYQLGDDELKARVKNCITELETIVGAAFFVIGVVIMFIGNMLIGLAVMLVGLATMGIAKATASDEMIEFVRGTITTLETIVGAAFLVIGAILTFSGVSIPIGLALLAAGAVLLVSAAYINWGAIKSPIESVISSILAIVSGALIVVGILLCLSGVGIGLGLALLFAGFSATHAAWTLDDNPITRFVKNMANQVIAIINTVIDAINDLFHIKFDGLNIAGAEIIPSFDKKLINLKHVPALAQGAVIPPNREFMAVLGDQRSGNNIEAPEELIRTIVREEAGGGYGEILRQILRAIQDGKVLAVDGLTFGRLVHQYGRAESARVGASLVNGGNV